MYLQHKPYRLYWVEGHVFDFTSDDFGKTFTMRLTPSDEALLLSSRIAKSVEPFIGRKLRFKGPHNDWHKKALRGIKEYGSSPFLTTAQKIIFPMSNTEKVHIDVTLVRRLIATQFPQWTDLPIKPVKLGGWEKI